MPCEAEDNNAMPAPMSGRPLLQIAPMLDVTYRDFRYFMRLLTRRAQLWTEMVVDDTVLHNLEPQKCDRFLAYHPLEHPTVCQLGGSDPGKLAQVAQVVERYGYDEINLNVGCPSYKVAQKGEFGCSLMLRKELVRDIVHAMSRAVQIPVTVKCRLGADSHDSPEFTREFVRTVAQGGCKHFIIHARKALLSGLSAAQNRSIPPLKYPRVLDLCHAFPELNFSLNGGVTDIGHARALLGFPGGCKLPGESADLIANAWCCPLSENANGTPGLLPSNLQGVMIGRGAMNNPVMLWDVDQTMYGDPEMSTIPTRRTLLDAYRSYLEETYPVGGEEWSVHVVHLATKPILTAFSGMRGNKTFRATMDAILRMPSSRGLGPAHVLAEALNTLESNQPGLLDLPLPQTQAYKPKESGSCGGGVAEDMSCGSTNNKPRGLKRKGINEDTAPAIVELPNSMSPVEPMWKEQKTGSATDGEKGKDGMSIVNFPETVQEPSSNVLAADVSSAMRVDVLVDTAKPPMPLASAMCTTNSGSEVQ